MRAEANVSWQKLLAIALVLGVCEHPSRLSLQSGGQTHERGSKQTEVAPSTFPRTRLLSAFLMCQRPQGIESRGIRARPCGGKNKADAGLTASGWGGWF